MSSTTAPRAKGDESGEVGVDITWASQLKRVLEAELLVTCVEDAVRCLHGLPTGLGDDVLDAEMLLDMVMIQRLNAQDIIEKAGLVGQVSVDQVVMIWLYTVEFPCLYKAINLSMFCSGRRNASGQISAHLKQAMPFIKYLDHVLRLLPEEFHFKGRCYRGIRWAFPSPDRHDVAKHFLGKRTVFFYEFKSATQDKDLMF
jgi:hypothetical protein